MFVETKGLKGHDLSLDLSQLTLLTGPTSSGKSTIAEAIRIIALGFVPALGRRLWDTACLMRGRKTEVTLTLEDGRTIFRKIEDTARGYTAGVTCSWLDATTAQKEHAAAALTLFGQEEQDIAEALDIRELLKASPLQRAARIEPLVASTAGTAKDQLLARYTTQQLLHYPDEHMPENWRPLLKTLDEAQQGIIRTVWPMVKAKLAETNPTAAGSWVNQQKRDAAQTLRAKTQAKHEIEARLGDLPDPRPEVIAQLEAERSLLEQAIGAEAERGRAVEAARATRHAAAQAYDTVVAALEMARAQAEKLPGLEADLFKHQEALGLVRSNLGMLALDEPRDAASAVSGLLTGAAALEEQAENTIMIELIGTTNQQADVARLMREREAHQANPWVAVLTIVAAIDKLVVNKTGSVATAVHKLAVELTKLAAAQMERSIQDIERDLETAQRQLLQAEHERRVQEQTAHVALQQRQELQQKALKCRQDARELQEAALAMRDSKRTAQRAAQAREQALREEIEALTASIGGTANALQLAELAFEHAKARLADCATTDLFAINQELPKKLDTVQQSLASLTKASATRTELGRIAGELGALEARRDVFAALETALQRLRAEDITQAGGPLARHMEAFFAGAGWTQRPYIRAKAGQFEIGWRTEDGTEVAAEALAGGEWCVFTAALTRSVLALRGGAVKVLLVEAAEPDEPTLLALLRGIQATAEGLTAAIVMTPHPVRSALPEGWARCALPLLSDAAAA